MESQNITWTYPFVNIGADKSGKRTSLLDTPQTAYELVGFEGNLYGGLRPSPGFLRLHDLDTISSNFQRDSMSINKGDFRTFEVRAADDYDISGYIFRINNGATYPIVAVYLQDGSWQEEVIFTGTTETAEWSTFTLGRFVYVYVAGETPQRFYFDQPGSTEADLTFSKQDVVVAEVEALDADAYDLDTQNLSTNEFDKGVSPNTTNRIFFGEAASITGTDGNSVTFPAERAWLEWTHRFTAKDTPVSGDDYIPASPLDLTNPQVREYHSRYGSTTFNTDYGGTGSGNDAATRFSIARVRSGSVTNIAYVLYNSTTGEESAPSNVVMVYAAENGTSSYVFPAFEGIIDSDTYDRVKVYRSVWGNPNSLTSAALFLALDESVANLTSEDQGTLTSGWTRISGVLALGDSGIQQTSDVLKQTELIAAPEAGIAHNYENTAFVIDNSGTVKKNVGEIFYSSTDRVAGERFSSINVFDLDQPSDPIIAMETVADNMIGWTRTQQYLVRKEGRFIKMVGMHKGYGIVGQHASTVYSGVSYYVTPVGLATTNNRGQFELVPRMDKIFVEDWASSIGETMMESDPQVSAIFIQNPTNEHMIIMWLRDGRFTELHDCTFVGMDTGNVPGSEDYGDRTIFCTGNGYTYIYDKDREKTDGSDERTSLLDLSDDIVLKYVANQSAAPGFSAFTVNDTDDAAATIDTEAEDIAYIYIASGDNFGRKAKITGISSNTITVDDEDFSGLCEAGTILALSPVYCRMVGSSLGVVSSTGERFNAPSAHMAKHIGYIGVMFTDVEGPKATTGVAKYKAIAYDSNRDTPKNGSLVLNPDGTEEVSIVENESKFVARMPTDAVFLFPGFEALACDFKFNAVSMRVNGSVRNAKQGGPRG